uniref:Insulin-like domain-containing protein n=1 Tax=Caenorhabditis japonica TaxID=281687 RepID=A0A8R1IHS9_CAEJA
MRLIFIFCLSCVLLKLGTTKENDHKLQNFKLEKPSKPQKSCSRGIIRRILKLCDGEPYCEGATDNGNFIYKICVLGMYDHEIVDLCCPK